MKKHTLAPKLALSVSTLRSLSTAKTSTAVGGMKTPTLTNCVSCTDFPTGLRCITQTPTVC